MLFIEVWMNFCPICATDWMNLRPICASDLMNLCPICASDLMNICPICASNLMNLCPVCALYVPRLDFLAHLSKSSQLHFTLHHTSQSFNNHKEIL